MDLFSYLPIIIAIRNDDFSHIHTPNTIVSNDKHDIHLRVLKKLADLPYPVAAVFENEIYITRHLANLSNNDMKNFLLTNPTWDILVVEAYTEAPSTPVEGYTLIEKVNDNIFRSDKVYIVSSRMMQKAKNNNLTDLQIYKYTSPFIENVESHPKTNKYTVSRVVGITLLDTAEVKYKWAEFHIN